MARTAKVVSCDEQTRQSLEMIARSHSEEVRLVRRAKIVLGCLDGMRIMDISAKLDEQEDVIIKWRERFVSKGIAGLYDAPRSGKPAVYGDEWKRTVLKKLEEKPPNHMV